jgi:hypothetical protein
MKGASSVVYVIALLLMACLAGGQCKHISSLAYHLFILFSQLVHNLLENLLLVVCDVYIHGYCALTIIAYWIVGRPETQTSYQDDRVNATTPELSSDESKIKLIMCVDRTCRTKSEPLIRTCVCCVTRPGVPCFHSKGVCQANCPPLKST